MFQVDPEVRTSHTRSAVTYARMKTVRSREGGKIMAIQIDLKSIYGDQIASAVVVRKRMVGLEQESGGALDEGYRGKSELTVLFKRRRVTWQAHGLHYKISPTSMRTLCFS